MNTIQEKIFNIFEYYDQRDVIHDQMQEELAALFSSELSKKDQEWQSKIEEQRKELIAKYSHPEEKDTTS